MLCHRVQQVETASEEDTGSINVFFIVNFVFYFIRPRFMT